MGQRIVVFSDSHNHIHTLSDIMRRHARTDLFLHLGDGVRDYAHLCEAFPERRILFVRGNCDLGVEWEQDWENTIDCGGVRIFYTHGHRYGVKQGTDRLLARTLAVGAGIGLFGHTHEAVNLYLGGVYLMNPGSTDQPRRGRASYGVIDLTGAGIAVRIIAL